jgi:thiol-disulfide isomerase/thioredoxin
MGKSARTQARSTREKVAASRAAARRADRRRRFLLASGGIALVVVLALVLIVVKPGQSPAAAAAGASTGTAAQDLAVARQVTSVPAATFNAVGAGSAAGLTTISGPALTSGGKPEVLYMGGEFCPYCAAERWALAAALSRFGTFTGLSLIHSSPTDAYPSTPTLSFYKSTYTSKYLSFTPVEWYGEADDASTPFGHVYLQQPTAAEAALFSKYAGGSIPFIDIGNHYLAGSQYLPSALSGMTWAQVAAAMRTPSSPVARDIDGAANIITAAIATITHGQPAGVSSSAGVTAAARSL